MSMSKHTRYACIKVSDRIPRSINEVDTAVPKTAHAPLAQAQPLPARVSIILSIPQYDEVDSVSLVSVSSVGIHP